MGAVPNSLHSIGGQIGPAKSVSVVPMVSTWAVDYADKSKIAKRKSHGGRELVRRAFKFRALRAIRPPLPINAAHEWPAKVAPRAAVRARPSVARNTWRRRLVRCRNVLWLVPTTSQHETEAKNRQLSHVCGSQSVMPLSGLFLFRHTV
jgi:hypothetical protein